MYYINQYISNGPKVIRMYFQCINGTIYCALALWNILLVNLSHFNMFIVLIWCAICFKYIKISLFKCNLKFAMECGIDESRYFKYFLHCSFHFVYSFGSFKSIVVLWFNLFSFLEIFQRLSAKFRGWIIYSVIYFHLTQSTKCIITKRNHYRGYIYAVTIKIGSVLRWFKPTNIENLKNIF